MTRTRGLRTLIAAVAVIVGLAGTAHAISIVATTTIVADVVRMVGGDNISLTVLLPVGADPHTYEPTPRDAVALSEARLVFVNGANLEAYLAPLLEASGAPLVSVSDGIPFRTFGSSSDESGIDPHVWFDPTNVAIWVGNIERALDVADPDHADAYAARAQAYRESLADLDRWIQEQVAAIPPEQRMLVSDHEDFGYFARRYGFAEVGNVIPGLSTLAEPSAHDLAALETAIRDRGVRAVFVGMTVNPVLAEQVAQDTGTKIIFLYTEALSAADGPASTYIDLMRFDVTLIAAALSGSP